MTAQRGETPLPAKPKGEQVVSQLSIDSQKCQGHAMCYLLSPELFQVDDEGRGEVIEPMIDATREQAAVVAIERCPEQAIFMQNV